jgi:hypothetical protein
MFSKKKFARENMKNPASKVAKPAQIQPKSQFLFHKNPPPLDFSIMTLLAVVRKSFIKSQRAAVKYDVDSHNGLK